MKRRTWFVVWVRQSDGEIAIYKYRLDKAIMGFAEIEDCMNILKKRTGKYVFITDFQKLIS